MITARHRGLGPQFVQKHYFAAAYTPPNFFDQPKRAKQAAH